MDTNVVLKRYCAGPRATMGVLWWPGQSGKLMPLCYTLEDVIRPVKIQGETAIPAGRYEVIVTLSKRFGYMLPLLVDVPDYAGVRIHPGNTAHDTEGCILPGLWAKLDYVGESGAAFKELSRLLSVALKGGRVWLKVENPPTPA
jgi:hypothetical protein